METRVLECQKRWNEVYKAGNGWAVKHIHNAYKVCVKGEEHITCKTKQTAFYNAYDLVESGLAKKSEITINGKPYEYFEARAL